jgi:hypothetical protein
LCASGSPLASLRPLIYEHDSSHHEQESAMRRHAAATGWILLSNTLLSFALAAAAGCSDDDSAPMQDAGGGSGGRAALSGTGGHAGNAGSKSAGSGGRAANGGSGGGGHAGAGNAGSGDSSDLDAGNVAEFSFFVSSQTNMTGDLGGLHGADTRCQTLAAAAGQGDRVWQAYLSVEQDPDHDNQSINARDRIGQGPWFNVKGVMLAANLTELHQRSGDPEVFLDEQGHKINGQWEGSPAPVQHDVLTGSDNAGMLLTGQTCKDWTSTDHADTAQVGHTDGLGPNRNDQPPYNSWNSAHANGGCDDTAPLGGSGRIYCFATGENK